MADLVGQQLGNYRLIRLLGRGGFAEVYLGEHIRLQTQVAIRALPPHSFRGNIDELGSEIQTLARLRHPNILAILDFDLEGKQPYIVEEYAPNGTLRQRHPKGTQLPLDTILPYVRQVASALDYIHAQKIIHRDLKAENMLIGQSNQILLSDFGIAVAAPTLSSPTITAGSVTGSVHGTAAYMAPEQIQGLTRPASDQYSLGIVVYEWLSGNPPFQGSIIDMVYQQISAPPPSMRKKVPTISPEVEQVVMTVLAKDPRQRFPSVGAFADALEQAARFEAAINRATSTAALPTSSGLPATPQLTEAALSGPFGRKILGSTVVTIGRSKDNELVLDDRQVSRHHAEVRSIGQGHTIVDLNSANGTFVNRQRIPPGASYVLKSGDMVGIGDTRLVYEGRTPADITVKSAPAPVPAWQGFAPGSTQPLEGGWGNQAGQQAWEQAAPPAAPVDPWGQPTGWGDRASEPPQPTGWGDRASEPPQPPAQTPGWGPASTPEQQAGWGAPAQQPYPAQTPGWGPASAPPPPPPVPGSYSNEPQEEPIIQAPQSMASKIESMPTTYAPAPTTPDLTYPTRNDDLAAAQDEEFATRSVGVGPPVEKTELSLFAIANLALEEGDLAFVGKMYSLQAGIARNKPDDFWGEPFELAVENPAEPITFDILLQESENIELFTSWHRKLRYRPDDAEPQIVTFKFQLEAAGKSSLVVDFYHERRWLRTMRFEFDAVEQSQPTPVSSEV